MGYAAKRKSADELIAFLAPLLRLSEEEQGRLEELLAEFVDTRCEDHIDSVFNRGDYRS